MESADGPGSEKFGMSNWGVPPRATGLGGTGGRYSVGGNFGPANLKVFGAVGLGRNGSFVRVNSGLDGGRGPSKVSGCGELLRSKTNLAAGLPDVGGNDVGKCIKSYLSSL